MEVLSELMLVFFFNSSFVFVCVEVFVRDVSFDVYASFLYLGEDLSVSVRLYMCGWNLCMFVCVFVLCCYLNVLCVMWMEDYCLGKMLYVDARFGVGNEFDAVR